MRCLVHGGGKPLRVKAGDSAHIMYICLGGCSDAVIFAALAKLRPRECLATPRDGSRGTPQQKPDFDAIWDIVAGPGTPAERLILVAIAANGGELPEGAMCDILADRLRLTPRMVYRATANLRHHDR
jgi:hypothetical protein